MDKEASARERIKQDREDWEAWKADPENKALIKPWMLIKGKEIKEGRQKRTKPAEGKRDGKERDIQ